MDFFSSEEIVASLGDKAEMKGKLSFVRLCILGIMAGFVLHWVTWRLFVSLELPPQNGEVLTTFWVELYFQLD